MLDMRAFQAVQISNRPLSKTEISNGRLSILNNQGTRGEILDTIRCGVLTAPEVRHGSEELAFAAQRQDYSCRQQLLAVGISSLPTVSYPILYW